MSHFENKTLRKQGNFWNGKFWKSDTLEIKHFEVAHSENKSFPKSVSSNVLKELFSKWPICEVFNQMIDL